MPHQDIILKTFKPVIINDEENKINKLKIKMKFTDETCSSNSSLNGIRTHSDNLIQDANMLSHNYSHQFKFQEKYKLNPYFNRLGYENIDQSEIKQIKTTNSMLNRNKQYDDKLSAEFSGNSNKKITNNLLHLNKTNRKSSYQHDEQHEELLHASQIES